jgi:hypothetical protein
MWASTCGITYANRRHRPPWRQWHYLLLRLWYPLTRLQDVKPRIIQYERNANGCSTEPLYWGMWSTEVTSSVRDLISRRRLRAIGQCSWMWHGAVCRTFINFSEACAACIFSVEYQTPLQLWKRRQYVHPIRRQIPTTLHRGTFQKIVTFTLCL